MLSKLLILLAVAAVVMMGWWTLFYLLQDRIIYPRDAAGTGPATFERRGAIDFTIQLDDGQSVEAWLVLPPKRNTSEPAPLVMFFHGNAELIDDQRMIVDGYHAMGVGVALLEYRGYGRSGGEPGQDEIRADAIAFYDRLLEHDRIDPDAVIFHGRSLGGAVAADLASARTPALLILESSFHSVGKMARKYAAPGILLKHPYDTANVVSSLNRPILMFHGKHDSIVPVEHGRSLAKLAKHATYVEFPCGHNDFPGVGSLKEYWDRIRSFVTEHGMIGRPRS